MLLCIIAIISGENPTLMPWPTSSVPISAHLFFVSLLTAPCTSHWLSSFSQQDHSHLRKFLVGIFPSQSVLLPHCRMTCFSPHLWLYENATSLEKSSFGIQSKISSPNPLSSVFFYSPLSYSQHLSLSGIIHTFRSFVLNFFWSLSPLEGSHDMVEHLIAF